MSRFKQVSYIIVLCFQALLLNYGKAQIQEPAHVHRTAWEADRGSGGCCYLELSLQWGGITGRVSFLHVRQVWV